MKEALAERLLAEVMGWTEQNVALERPELQAMATYKYDGYQQFSPGIRFVESLALWLSQFTTIPQRLVAYEFVKTRLIFCSTAETNHLVAMAYEDHVRPYLLRKAAIEAGFSPWHVGKVATTTEFRIRQRRSLFLGLSDGARMDTFRRFNMNLSHEQVRHSHEIPDERVDELLKELAKSLEQILKGKPDTALIKFRTLVLLDDFSGSGFSYLRIEEDRYAGKIGKLFHGLTNADNPLSKLVSLPGLEVVVVLYMATQRSIDYLTALLREMWEPYGVEASVIVIFPLSSDVTLDPNSCGKFAELIDQYYDSENETDATRKGKTDLRYGFGSCGLPLVLSHNTPNNSIGLLWAEGSAMWPLFPRVTRHKDQP